MGAGYFRQPDETAATFSDGWIRTGDLGYIDGDRELFLAGRQKDLIIQNGVKVAPREVVEVLRGLPDVGECAVVGVPHALLGEQVVACVVRRAAAQITADQILAHCRVHLDPRKVPVRVWFGDELPKTSNHKIDAPALRQRLMSEQAAVIDTDAVRRIRSAAAAEQIPLLRDVVHQQLLRILPASDRAPSNPATGHFSATFGELGLDSLRIAQLGQLLGEALGRSIAPTLFFGHPTGRAVLDPSKIAGSPLRQGGGRCASRRARRVAACEPVAIIGFGCRLPGGADSPEQYWSLLQKGIDATADISRWNVDAVYDPARGTPGRTYTRRAALLDSPEMFDAEFFGIRPREVVKLDPQHRLLLEVTWEAIEHAGYDPRSLSGGLAGLYVGINGASPAGGSGLGAAPSMAVGRICHFLDLRGPAVAVDTSCSSSLSAIHNAVQSLRLGECDVGGRRVRPGTPRRLSG
jgi:pimaricinolide synthase loading module/candicidin polyketide synthase FscA